MFQFNSRSARRVRTASTLTAVLAAALLAGCAKRDSITVGAVPDDYRTNHPIVVAEKEEVIDLPVASSERGMTKLHRVALDGFFSRYDRSAGALVTILVPVGSMNAAAAQYAAAEFAQFAYSRGVHQGRLIVNSYQANSEEVSAPVRVSYTNLRAQTDKCGRWPEDLLQTSDNKHYANFGCASQNNLAAQIANPADLLGPRKSTEVDAENRSEVIDVYRGRGISGEFIDRSEILY